MATLPAALRPPPRLLERLSGYLWHPAPAVRGRVVAALALASVLVWALVYATGGSKHPYLHAMYLPIGAAALLYGAPWGLGLGLVGGVLLGPLMPLDVAAGAAQPLGAWLYRLLFFALFGGLMGGLGSLLHERLQRSEGLHRELGRVYAKNLRTFARLVAERDELTNGHCERVAHNAVALGRRLGLAESALRQLHWAGLLHDLGKIGVPEAILRKPGRLTGEEYALMQRHAALGHEILISISDDFRAIAEGVRGHHERWDGQGYPQGLEGERIPLFGRILAVVDVFEAVTSHRPYREPMPLDEAVALIGGGSGTQFEPRLVSVFLQAYEAGEITLEGAGAPAGAPAFGDQPLSLEDLRSGERIQPSP